MNVTFTGFIDIDDLQQKLNLAASTTERPQNCEIGNESFKFRVIAQKMMKRAGAAEERLYGYQKLDGTKDKPDDLCH